MTAGETWDSCLEEVRQLPSVQKYGDDVKVSMYMYDRPSWKNEVYETECYFPTWINKESSAHVKALVEAHKALFGEKRIGSPSAMHLRDGRPLCDKWTFSTNGVSIQGRYGIPCVGFGPGAESQAHAPNEITWKQDLVTCAALYAAAIPLYPDQEKDNNTYHAKGGAQATPPFILRIILLKIPFFEEQKSDRAEFVVITDRLCYPHFVLGFIYAAFVSGLTGKVLR